MPIDLLTTIAGRRLPARFTDAGEVDTVRELIRQGYVLGVTADAHAAVPFATVMMLTRKGMNVLRHSQTVQ